MSLSPLNSLSRLSCQRFNTARIFEEIQKCEERDGVRLAWPYL